MTILTLYVPSIITNYVNKPTSCTFCMYLFCNFWRTLRVSNDHSVHHQEFMICCILQLCTNHANVTNYSVLRLELVLKKTVPTVLHLNILHFPCNSSVLYLLQTYQIHILGNKYASFYIVFWSEQKICRRKCNVK